jgi:hypothetical protein
VWFLPSENSSLDFLKLIMNGDIDSAFKRLEEWYPQVIKVYYTVSAISTFHKTVLWLLKTMVL